MKWWGDAIDELKWWYDEIEVASWKVLLRLSDSTSLVHLSWKDCRDGLGAWCLKPLPRVNWCQSSQRRLVITVTESQWIGDEEGIEAWAKVEVGWGWCWPGLWHPSLSECAHLYKLKTCTICTVCSIFITPKVILRIRVQEEQGEIYNTHFDTHIIFMFSRQYHINCLYKNTFWPSVSYW